MARLSACRPQVDSLPSLLVLTAGQHYTKGLPVLYTFFRLTDFFGLTPDWADSPKTESLGIIWTGFLQAECPSCQPTNTVKALKGKSTTGPNAPLWQLPNASITGICTLSLIHHVPKMDQLLQCRWQICTKRCIMANVLQTSKLDAPWDKLVTKLS